MKRELVWILGAGLVCVATPAFADGDPTADPNAPAGATSPAATAPAGAAAAGTGGVWGTAINDRPLVLDPGKFDVHLQLPIYAFNDGMGTSAAEALNVGATYGLLPKLEVGVDYLFALNPDGGFNNSILGLRGAYAAMHSDKMDLAISAELTLDFFGSTSASLSLGAWFRYRLTHTLSLFTGQPATPASQDIAFGAGTIPSNQLFIGLNNSQAVALALPVGIGAQVTPQVWLFASTTLAEFYFTNNPGKSAELIFADNIPITIGGFYSVNPALDLGVSFSDDLEHAGDFYSFVFTGRYFIK